MEEKEGRADGEIRTWLRSDTYWQHYQQKQTASFDFKKKGFQLLEYFPSMEPLIHRWCRIKDVLPYEF